MPRQVHQNKYRKNILAGIGLHWTVSRFVWICIRIYSAVNARSHDGHVTVARNLIRRSRRWAHHVKLVMSHDRRSRSQACSRVLNHRRHRCTRHRVTGGDVMSTLLSETPSSCRRRFREQFQVQPGKTLSVQTVSWNYDISKASMLMDLNFKI
jgi:hypothetical protein